MRSEAELFVGGSNSDSPPGGGRRRRPGTQRPTSWGNVKKLWLPALTSASAALLPPLLLPAFAEPSVEEAPAAAGAPAPLPPPPPLLPPPLLPPPPVDALSARAPFVPVELG